MQMFPRLDTAGGTGSSGHTLGVCARVEGAGLCPYTPALAPAASLEPRESFAAVPTGSSIWYRFPPR